MPQPIQDRTTYRVEYWNRKHHTYYQEWCHVLYRGMAEAICRREGQACPGVHYRVIEVPAGKSHFAGQVVLAVSY